MRLVEFNGARRIPLVGRYELLKEAERRIGRGGVHLIHVEGEGGVGKTALLEAILEQSQRLDRAADRANDRNTCSVAESIIDLYHVDVHTSEGLIRGIIEVLGKWSFAQTQEVLEALDHARAAGDMDVASERAKALRILFLEEFMALTEGGVVLAFDTLETLEYERDPFQEEVGAEMPTFGAGEWLFRSFFPALRGNVVVLLAGRPGGLRERLEALHEQHPRILVPHIPLASLNQEETKAYLKAIAQAEGKRGEGDAAARLWAYCEERGDAVHALTGGRPILLALVADMVAHGWNLPPSFARTSDELQQRNAELLRQEVEQALVVRIQESPTPIGDTLRALAWLRKGATPELLARVMDLKTSRGEWDIYSATGYLDQVAQLALVKVRPGDRRIFLHDEMYSLLETHVLQKSSQEETDWIYHSIEEHYQGVIEELERRIEQYPPSLITVRARLRQALAEELHYRLRYSPPLGFAMYFWLAEESLGGRDIEMDMLLRTECLRTIGMLETNGYFAGFVPREAELDAAVRWGMRALFFQSDPERALNLFGQIRRRWAKEAGKLGLSWMHLQLYRAVAKIQRAYGDDWQDARALLRSVVQRCDEILHFPAETPVVEGRHWRARILKGLALNFRGYLDRQQGRYLEAVQHYQESAMLQRRLGMAFLAPTLTNLSYAMALTGETHQARLLVEEAERLARRSGKDHMLALTLDVRALVELYDGHFRSALHYTDRALDIAVNLPAFRVRGLIYRTRAMAHRYLWNSLTDDERTHQLDFFDEALREANQAVSLLRNSPTDRVDALIERGCTYRELARLYHLCQDPQQSRNYAQKSQADLERAAVLAGAIDIPGHQALAWTNVGWLHYYLGNTDEVHKSLEQAYAACPEEYLFPDHGPTPPMADPARRSEAALPYWNTLGKAEMLKAYIALDQAREAKEGDDYDARLRVAVRGITFSLAYDELIADAYFDLTRAEEALHRRILHDGLSIGLLHEQACQVAEANGLEVPTRFQRFLTRMFGPMELWAQ
jgi:tetratricopeptide (TPR) repeat protein